MGHASDLPRQIFLLICSFFLPVSFLRYFYTFLMLLIGPLGMFYLLKYLIRRKQPAFLGALFYLFNLATVQTFYVPFSTFTTHYAFLPWLIFVLIRYLRKPTRKNLLWFAIVSILAIPQSYVPTIFIVYLMAITPFVVSNILLGTRKKQVYQKVVKLLLIIFCVNAFWLLPFLYFAFTNADGIGESKINQMVSEEVFLRNKEFGNLKNVTLLKGFWFDNKDLDKSGNYFFMLKPWIEHLNKPYVALIGYGFFLIILLGIGYCLKKKKPWFYRSLLFLFFFSFAMLAIDTPPFSWLNSILRHYLPLFDQIFRFPFTKFSVLAAFSYAIFFALGIESVSLFSAKLWKNLPIFLTAIISLSLATFNLPSFQGNLIYERVKLKIPQEYFDLFEFFKKQDKTTRIANFPQGWHWGWTYYQWNYTGSGFLWYGIEQPILDRAFDVWNDKNEGYYWEISHAVYAHDLSLLENVLKKYQVNWVLIDESVYTHAPSGALLIERLKQMLDSSNIASFITSFDKLIVYQIELPLNEKKFVFFTDKLVKVEPVYKWANEDRAFAEQGTYYSSSTSHFSLPNSFDYYYPFRELFTNNYLKDKNWWIEVKDKFIFLKTNLPVDKKWTPASIRLGSLWQKKEKALVYQNGPETYDLLPIINLEGNQLEIQVSKYNLVRNDEIDFTQKIGKKETCDPLKKGKYDLEVLNQGEKKFIRLSSINTSSCTGFNFPSLDYKYSYLLEIESKNTRGKQILFYVLNEKTRNAELEILLPKSKIWTKNYYVLPPKVLDGKGYSLHFDNVSLGKEETINDIGNITIYPIPFDFLKELRFSYNEQIGIDLISDSSPNKVNFSVEKRNPSLYQIRFQDISEKSDKLLLVLSQSYHPGWKLLGIKAPHVLVNNWANGWILESSKLQVPNSKLYIIFWPQVLEYIGFGLWLTIPLIIRSLQSPDPRAGNLDLPLDPDI